MNPPRKHLANKDGTTFYSVRYSDLCNLFLVVEISMARTSYLNESKSNLPSPFCRSVSHSEEGNNQLCLDNLLHLYQYYFRHIRIKEPPSPRKIKLIQLRFNFSFSYMIRNCFRPGWKRSNYFFVQVLILSQNRGMKMDQFPIVGRIDGKKQTSCPFSSYSLI